MNQALLKQRDEFEKYVNECELRTPEEVARLFKEYTALIWDYKLVGYCNKFYHESTVIHRENGESIGGAELTVAGTLGFEAEVKDLKLHFVDIFAEEDGNGGYKFAQACYYDGVNEGPTDYGEPSGLDMAGDNEYCFGLCMLDVRKIDGEWKQAEEWLVRDSLGMKDIYSDNKKNAPACESEEEV